MAVREVIEDVISEADALVGDEGAQVQAVADGAHEGVVHVARAVELQVAQVAHPLDQGLRGEGGFWKGEREKGRREGIEEA